ncbi:NuA4-domain-containing protein [Microthyrium microscopicum]|uniref:Chromatin modification-related protein EAF6 n=1 Tax=Microthyrium microscopicum TaxID=703497 RepID=A0A6A6UPK4_9PEZI|nr:NuA4-domain-containing protein [Microthyrium microscopicum]
MAENAPPPTAAPAANDSSRGMPYYEKLRKDLRDALQRKRTLDQNLANIEDNIYRMESSYLDDTGAGNIIKGFDNYMKGATGTTAGSMGGGTATRRKGGITEADRIFSRSSAVVNRDSPAPSTTTSSHAPTPTSGAATPGATNTNPKKHKKSEADEDEKPAKRGKITFSIGLDLRQRKRPEIKAESPEIKAEIPKMKAEIPKIKVTSPTPSGGQDTSGYI